MHSRVAHWTSPNERRIAYINFNDTLVPLYKFQVHGPPQNLYTSIHQVPYPKVHLLSCRIFPRDACFVTFKDTCRTYFCTVDHNKHATLLLSISLPIIDRFLKSFTGSLAHTADNLQ